MTEANQVETWIRRGIFLWWGVGIGLWATWSIANQLQSLLTQIVLALFISFALEPVVEKLMRRGLRRGLATAIALFGVLIMVITFLGLMGTLIASQLTELAAALPDYLRDGRDWLEEQFGFTLVTEELLERLQTGGAAEQMAARLGDVVTIGTTAAGALFQTLTVLLLTFYLTADGPRFRRTVCSFIPAERQHRVLAVWELAITKTGAYISSRVLLALISAAFHWAVFVLLGLPSALALGLWVGVISQFIPAIGTYIAGTLPVLVALGVDPGKSLIVIAAVVIYQQIENYLLQPRITAQTLDLHPGVSITAVLAGTSLFGAAGAFLALPVVATASGFVSAYFERHDVVEGKLTSSPTGPS